MPSSPHSSRRKGVDRALGHLRELDREDLSHLTEKLCCERAILSAVLHSLQEGVLLIDRWGKIELINASAKKILGFDEQAQELPNLWRAAPEIKTLLKVTSDGTLNLSGAVVQSLEVHYPVTRQLRLYATDLREQILLVLSDQTDIHEGRLRESESTRMNALTQLAAGVAHELGNPLNALQIHLQVIERALEKEKLSPKGQAITRSVKISLDEVRRLDQIIRNFLNALRPSAPNLTSTDLLQTLEEVVSVLLPELTGAKIRVEVELPGALPPVMADPEQVKQVYFNLLKNAREASPVGSLIKIRASLDEQFLHLHFIDGGSGIRNEHLTHLFEPYYTTKKGGTGLGLTIVQKIMHAHHGSVKVESQPSRGTTVTLSFPLRYRRFKTLSAAASTAAPRLPQ